MIEGGPGQDEFYLTLPSDSSKAYFDKQDASHFFTKLHGGVQLDPGEWMVGLAEITYPATYDNIPVSEFTAEYHVPDKLNAVHRSRCVVRAKHYIAPQNLINDWLKSFISHPNHSYYRDKRKIRLAYDKSQRELHFPLTGPTTFSNSLTLWPTLLAFERRMVFHTKKRTVAAVFASPKRSREVKPRWTLEPTTPSTWTG